MYKSTPIKDNNGRDVTEERAASDLLNEKCRPCKTKKMAAETKIFIRNVQCCVAASIILVVVLVNTYLGYPSGGSFAGIICTLLVIFAYRTVVFLNSRTKNMDIFSYFNKDISKENTEFKIKSFDEKCLKCLAKKRVDEKIKLLKRIVTYTAACLFFNMLGSTYIDDRLIYFFGAVGSTLMVLLTYYVLAFFHSSLKFKIPFKKYYQNAIDEEYIKLKLKDCSQIEIEIERD